MTWPYRYIGGNNGEVELPEGMAADFPAWELRRFRWCGDERWAVRRHVPPPPEARGVAASWVGWSDEERIRVWLRGQDQVMADERIYTSAPPP
ncbi:hypothetical protein [Streptomonospora wellingtoniae]|uniref:Uncharacterized protein n=1 Tax=Streptomonospora wellingtoniae TaxID=3075544 RepID=A0ABU2KW69_9ACTN|nr:hypothetical protein [Streptomonospora sp. DSM 45055]MDT0303544.1 hypothetical protein [Streptomonospora sp. DSM 45055]